MGERIRAARWLLSALRRSELKYSFEHAAANTLLGLACMVLLILGERKLWVMLFIVLAVSLAVQGFRVWWFVRRQRREFPREADANA